MCAGMDPWDEYRSEMKSTCFNPIHVEKFIKATKKYAVREGIQIDDVNGMWDVVGVFYHTYEASPISYTLYGNAAILRGKLPSWEEFINVSWDVLIKDYPELGREDAESRWKSTHNGYYKPAVKRAIKSDS